MFGCDAEFIALNSKKQKIRRLQKYGIPHEGLVGWDHNGRVLEVRPSPSETIEGLVQNTKESIAVAKNMLLKSHKIITCTFYKEDPEALGCHFHFSYERMPHKWWDNLVNLLSVYVGLPLLLLNSNFDEIFERYVWQQKHYGAIDNFRYCYFYNEDHRLKFDKNNTPDGIEYRSLSAISLSSEELFKSCLTLYNTIIQMYINGERFPKNVGRNICIYKDIDSVYRTLDKFCVWDFLKSNMPITEYNIISNVCKNGGIPLSKVCISKEWGI